MLIRLYTHFYKCFQKIRRGCKTTPNPFIPYIIDNLDLDQNDQGP